MPFTALSALLIVTSRYVTEAIRTPRVSVEHMFYDLRRVPFLLNPYPLPKVACLHSIGPPCPAEQIGLMACSRAAMPTWPPTRASRPRRSELRSAPPCAGRSHGPPPWPAQHSSWRSRWRPLRGLMRFGRHLHRLPSSARATQRSS